MDIDDTVIFIMLGEATESLRDYIAQQNYYIVVPERLERHPQICERIAQTGMRFADINAAELVIADTLLQEQEGWDPLVQNTTPAFELEQQEEAILIEISRRKKFIISALGKVGFDSSEEGANQLQYDNQPVSELNVTPEHLALARIIKKSKTAQDQIRVWLLNQARIKSGLIAFGKDASIANTPDFIVINALFSEDTDESKDLSMLVDSRFYASLRSIVREASSMRRIVAEQAELGVQRDKFTWQGNTLIGRVRAEASNLIKTYCAELAKYGVTEFDLSMQVMMHLPTYPAELVWKGDKSTIEQICALIKQEDGQAANSLLEEAITSGLVELNMDLVRDECARHAKKLEDLYVNLKISVDGKTTELPSQYMGDPEHNPFKSVARAEIDARNRSMLDGTTMAVKEKYTGRTILFKPISLDMSRLYSLGFSNLHYAREGEIAAFGAFLEDDEFPFAYSAYSSVTRAYTKDMLHYYGIDPATVLDSTRAWNAHWAPENTMSTLFAYAHTMLKGVMDEGKILRGVMTSINPNLGFRAVSFRGVRFNVAGLKPTDFSFLANTDGTADFMPKGMIKERLNIADDKELEHNPRFVRCRIPLLPTVELLSLFDRSDEARLLDTPIYRITPDAMRRG